MDVRVGPQKPECIRIYGFELWCWRRLLRVPWTTRSNQVLKEINPEFSLEGLVLKLKPQYFGHLMWRADSFEKNPNAGKDWRQGEKGTTEDEMVGWHHQLHGHKMDMYKLWELVMDREAWRAVVHGSQRVRHDWATTELNWTQWK